MARGSEAKQKIFNKLLEVFPGSFMQDDKILRIVESEGGEPVEIKVSLTAAKDILGGAAASPVPSPTTVAADTFNWDEPIVETGPSIEEKENIKKMMAALGL